jgi:hypothetical protein
VFFRQQKHNTYRGKFSYFYRSQLGLKILPKNTKPINIMQLIEEIPMPGRIHREKLAA